MTDDVIRVAQMVDNAHRATVRRRASERALSELNAAQARARSTGWTAFIAFNGASVFTVSAVWSLGYPINLAFWLCAAGASASMLAWIVYRRQYLDERAMFRDMVDDAQAEAIADAVADSEPEPEPAATTVTLCRAAVGGVMADITVSVANLNTFLMQYEGRVANRTWPPEPEFTRIDWTLRAEVYSGLLAHGLAVGWFEPSGRRTRFTSRGIARLYQAAGRNRPAPATQAAPPRSRSAGQGTGTGTADDREPDIIDGEALEV